MIVETFFFFQAEDGIRAGHVTGVQTCALPISPDRTGIQAKRLAGDLVGDASLRDQGWRGGACSSIERSEAARRCARRCTYGRRSATARRAAGAASGLTTASGPSAWIAR